MDISTGARKDSFKMASYKNYLPKFGISYFSNSLALRLPSANLWCPLNNP